MGTDDTEPTPAPGRPPSDGTIRLSVVVPAYQEGDRIASTVTAIRDEFADLDPDGLAAALEVIVVDDGSGDATAEEASGAEADQIVVLPVNSGKGAAVRAGMLASRGRCVAFCDADLAYHPRHLRRVLEEVEAGWDVVIGNRRHPDSALVATSGMRAIGSRLVNRLAAVVLLAAPLDTQCGLKGFRGELARDLFSRTRIDGFTFDIEVLHLAERGGWTLQQIPVSMDDTGDRSTVRLTDAIVVLRDLAKIRYWSSRGRY